MKPLTKKQLERYVARLDKKPVEEIIGILCITGGRKKKKKKGVK